MGKMKTQFVGDGENKNEKKHEEAHKGEAEKVHVAGLKGGQRVTIVDAAVTEEAPIVEEGMERKAEKKVVEKVRGKKYVEAKAKFDREKFYKVAEAIKLVKTSSYSKFDGTMELHMVFKKSGISGQVTLPFQAGKTKKVEIADENTIEKLRSGKIDFDI